MGGIAFHRGFLGAGTGDLIYRIFFGFQICVGQDWLVFRDAFRTRGITMKARYSSSLYVNFTDFEAE